MAAMEDRELHTPDGSSSDSARRTPARQRVTDAAMRLFAEQGYAATSVAQIEAAAGLRAGSGGLYRHFSSKRELFGYGVRQQLAAGRSFIEFIGDPQALAARPLRDRLLVIARAGLARLDEERDLNRIILRDLRDFPDLVELVREVEMGRIQTVLAGWLRAQVNAPSVEVDWDALAAVLMGAVSHYWVLRDAMGAHPSGVGEEAYLDALVALVVARFGVE